eukprot:365303-Chlamydomonas_euryale.AAC.3
MEWQVKCVQYRIPCCARNLRSRTQFTAHGVLCCAESRFGQLSPKLFPCTCLCRKCGPYQPGPPSPPSEGAEALCAPPVRDPRRRA